MQQSVVVAKPDGDRDAFFGRLLSMIGVLDRVTTAGSVLIKPNLCAGTHCWPESGVVTNRELLIDFCKFVRRANPRVRLLVGESDSAGFGFAYDKFRAQSYAILADECQVELVDLSRTELQLYEVPRPYYFKRGIYLSRVFNEVDVFVSFGKIKTHNMTTVSGALKNLFGCLPEFNKYHHHPRIHNAVADLAQAIRPDISLLDGMPAHEGNGPVHGTPWQLGVVVAGADPVATDSASARILGFDPRRVRHLMLAENAGVGQMCRRDAVTCDGASLDKLAGRRAKFVTMEERLLTSGGLMVQAVGNRVAAIGHLLHMQRSLASIVASCVRNLRRRRKRQGNLRPAQPER
jgi:uncharacterized protein (DUF362 family)